MGKFKSLVLCSILIFSASSRAAAQDSRATVAPLGLRNVGIDQKLNSQVSLDLGFRDERGEQIQLKKYFNKKPVILALVYYECPMLCTQILNGLVQSLNVLSFEPGNEFDVVAVSFDPRETAQLAASKKEMYLKRMRKGEDAGWHFLTGDENSIKALTQAVGFRYSFDPDKNQFAHASAIIVLTPEGKVSRYFYGVEYAPRDLRLGLVEASQNKIGSPVDQILLFCFHYDPSMGKYSAAVFNLVRLVGAITLIVLGVFFYRMWKFERRRKEASV